MSDADGAPHRRRAVPRRPVLRRLGLTAVVLLLVAVLGGSAFVAWKLPPPATALADPPRGGLAVSDGTDGRWQIGKFTVELGEALTIMHPDAAVPVWQTAPREAFLSAGTGEAEFVDDLGLLRIRDRLTRRWTDQRIDAVTSDDAALELSGTLTGSDTGIGSDGSGDNDSDAIPWTMRLREVSPNLLEVAVSVGTPADRIHLTAALEGDERVHGLGAQSAGWDLRGERIPLIPREQGIGRGEQPLSLLVDLAARAAGGQDTTYLSSAVHVTDQARSLVYGGDAIASLDLRADDRMVWEVWHREAVFAIAAANDPAEAVRIQSERVGAAAPPPAWTSTGLIAGLQGGTDAVREKVATLQQAGVPLAAVWLQDWVGRRSTDFGDRLQWNWHLDETQYPDWDALVAELEAQGIRVLTYVNPSLSADSGRAAAQRGGRDLYAEAAAAGYLAVDAEGEVLEVDQHGFTAAGVDLSNPEAREWFARVIADDVAGVGASGWMADFAEGPPPDAQLFGGDGIDWRVRWPVLWQQVNQRALELAGLEEDGFVWHRSGSTASAALADALWLGDQMQDWSTTDGLASTVTLTQSLSASGMAQVHGDIGGYTSVALPLFGDVVRDDELFVRWAEASLLQPVFRTHEGNRPAHAAQPAEDPTLATQLAELTRLFVALAPERARLAADGPLAAAVHHPAMLQPKVGLDGAADHELQLGPDVLLAPVVTRGADAVDVVFPPGRWVHAWSGDVFGESDAVSTATVRARLGEPALFTREGSAVADEIARFVAGR